MAKSKAKTYKKKSKASASDVKSDDVYVHDSDDGGVNSDDDESIADSGSEVGWNSGDETAFNTNKGDVDSEDDEDVYDDEDELQDGEVLLSDLLAGNSKFSSSGPSSKQKINTSEYFDNSASENEDNEEDDEVDSDEENESAVEEEEEEDDDNEDDGSDEDNHEALLAVMEKYAKGASKKKVVNNGSIVSQSAKESEFSSMMGARGQNAVSMEELLGALEGTSSGELAAMRQTLTGLTQSKGPPKHVHKVVADRVERSLSYKDKSEDMKKWQNTVTDNKNARTLDLAQDRRQLPSYRSLIKNYEASNDMEKEVQMILLSGKDEAAMEKDELDELGQGNLSVEEMRARQDELGKVRALLFYEQMKRHRVNKIKSKAYHRILKRKKKREEEKGKEALQEAGYDSEEDSEQMKNMTEEEAVRRIKERMDLRHHNTSKWARMAAKHSNGNKSLREAYHESVLLGHELTVKANNASGGLKDDDMNDDGGWSDDGGGNGKKTTTGRAAGEIVSALAAAKEDVELDGKYGGLYKMDFMKKAKERQQDRAREEATEILRDIEMMEREAERDSGDEAEEERRRNNQGGKKRSAEDLEKLAAAREEMRAKMSGSSSLVLGKSSSESATAASVAAAQQNPWLNAAPSDGRSLEVMSGRKSKKVKGDSINDVLLGNQSWDDSQVLFSSGAQDSKSNSSTTPASSNKKQKKRGKGNNNSDEAGESVTAVAIPSMGTEAAQVPKKALASSGMSQAALVHDAFAGPDYEDEFGALKEKLVDEELDIVGKKRQIESADKAGWGDWAGPGKVGVSQRVVKKRKHLLKNLEEKAAQQRAGRSDGQLANVILSERRVKTSAKYKIASVPHPFTSREEYERSLQMPLGDEWNASHIVKKNVKPEILTRAGRIIEPISLPKNYKRTSSANDAAVATGKRASSGTGSKTAKNKSLNRTAKFF